MQKRNMRSGSCLLSIMLLITLVSLFCIHMWRMTCIALDLSLEKQRFEKKFHVTQGLLEHGISLCKNNFDAIYDYNTTHAHGLIIEIKQWNVAEEIIDLSLQFSNKKKDNRYYIMIESCLLHHANPLLRITSNITRSFDQEKQSFCYKVNKWSLNKT